MAEAKPVVLTNMCMIRDGEKVLVQIRNDKRWGGAVFPGGHIEDGESITDSVIREFLKRRGLLCSLPCFAESRISTTAMGTGISFSSLKPTNSRERCALLPRERCSGKKRKNCSSLIPCRDSKSCTRCFALLRCPSCGITTVRLTLFRVNCANKTLQNVDKI